MTREELEKLDTQKIRERMQQHGRIILPGHHKDLTIHLDAVDAARVSAGEKDAEIARRFLAWCEERGIMSLTDAEAWVEDFASRQREKPVTPESFADEHGTPDRSAKTEEELMGTKETIENARDWHDRAARMEAKSWVPGLLVDALGHVEDLCDALEAQGEEVRRLREENERLRVLSLAVVDAALDVGHEYVVKMDDLEELAKYVIRIARGQTREES